LKKTPRFQRINSKSQPGLLSNSFKKAFLIVESLHSPRLSWKGNSAGIAASLASGSENCAPAFKAASLPTAFCVSTATTAVYGVVLLRAAVAYSTLQRAIIAKQGPESLAK